MMAIHLYMYNVIELSNMYEIQQVFDVSIHFNYCFPFQFLKIKGKTEKITERNFRPNGLEHFQHLHNVLRKHGNGDSVWRSFALLLECHNHLNKGKNGGNKVSQRFLKITCT